MQMKLIALTTGLVLAVAGLASSAVAAAGSCPELRAACQPFGDRPEAQKPKPRAEVIRLKAAPKVDSSGQYWRAGNHVMQ